MKYLTAEAKQTPIIVVSSAGRKTKRTSTLERGNNATVKSNKNWNARTMKKKSLWSKNTRLFGKRVDWYSIALPLEVKSQNLGQQMALRPTDRTESSRWMIIDGQTRRISTEYNKKCTDLGIKQNNMILLISKMGNESKKCFLSTIYSIYSRTD